MLQIIQSCIYKARAKHRETNGELIYLFEDELHECGLALNKQTILLAQQCDPYFYWFKATDGRR